MIGKVDWLRRPGASLSRGELGVGTHAAGDRAVRTVLEVYEAVAAQVGGVPPSTLVIEHALLSDAGRGPARCASGSG